ncbi:flavoprotein [Blastopirellula marina]|uniref:Phosphopantothenoylcysteine decarboxylase n=1 Tax=Blastopirellula marina TaxID=124 RepID=A0A2S8GMS4_9BACT|nr:flavoprotein [Blastopirellula marina]PQO45743.1 phosphopantothenoylcysteine decarboxylase [Blastopirellula marina]
MIRRRVAIGVTGGVAAYKTAMLVSRLVQSDIDVTTVLTAAATKFIGAATFAALTGKPPALDAFDPHYPLGPHIEIAKSAELLCIAPASADFLAKTAHGAADDLLSTLYLAFTGPVLMAPAMNREMWSKPSVQRNVQQLVADGVEMIGPGSGWLSCRDQGAGRMSEPDEIVAAIQSRLATLSK